MSNVLQQLVDSVKVGTGGFGLLEFCISIVFSMIVGICCMYLYRLYFHRIYDRNESLARSFALIAPAITAIFWAIQYSLPLSLGLLGALSFVRFRTPIKKSEDIGFILLVIALSLLSSVYRFIAAAVLLIIVIGFVSIRTFLRHKHLAFLRMGTSLTAFVATKSNEVDKVDKTIRETLLREFSVLRNKDVIVDDVVQKEVGHSMRYALYFKHYDEDVLSKIVGLIEGLNDIETVEVFRGNVA